MRARDEAPLGCGACLVVMMITGALGSLFYAAWEYGSPLVFALVVVAVLGVTTATLWTDGTGRQGNLVRLLILMEVVLTVTFLQDRLGLAWWQASIILLAGGMIVYALAH